MQTRIRTICAGIALTTALAIAPAYADMLKFKAMLSGAQEVPPTTSKGMGSIDITYDSATKTLSWTGSYMDLTGPATMAHFHGPADAGKNAPVEIPLKAVASPLEGSAVLTDAQIVDMACGILFCPKNSIRVMHKSERPDRGIRLFLTAASHLACPDITRTCSHPAAPVTWMQV